MENKIYEILSQISDLANESIDLEEFQESLEELSDEFGYSVEADVSDHPMGPDMQRDNLNYHIYYGKRALEKGDLEAATKHARAALTNSEELMRHLYTRYKRGEIGREDMRKELSYHVRNQGDYHKAMGEIHRKEMEDALDRYKKGRMSAMRSSELDSIRKEASHHAQQAERHLFTARDKYIKVRQRKHWDIGRKIPEVNDLLEDVYSMHRAFRR